MKKITYLLAFVSTLCSVLMIQAQDKQSNESIQLTDENQRFFKEYGVIRCATVENEAVLKKKYPKRATTEQFEQWLAPKIAKIKADRAAGRLAPNVVYNIPVVIHVIHNGEPIGTAPNITDAQAISQITVMNEDFRRIAGTRGGANTTGAAVDVEINFCLAKQDPNGDPTTGIDRVNMGETGWSGPGGDTDTVLKPATIWDPTRYLNMWTVNFDNPGLLGFAQFPSDSGLVGLDADGGPANTDGVVANYNAFGTLDADDGTFLMNPTYQLGRTMTHEVGHWLGLRHIWGDGGCGVDDFCADTPESDASNGGCPTTHVSCGTTDMVQNYMDYTDDPCMDTFTQDQKDRMVAVMENSPRRGVLNNSIACLAPAPIIAFASTESTEAEGTSCVYRDVNVTMTIEKAPSANATVTFTNSGTAVEGEDFDFQTPSVIFPSGATGDQTLVLRIYEDSFDESSETIIIGMNLSTSGDAVITPMSNKETTVTITDDDERIYGLTTVFSDDFESYPDFEIGNIGGWTMNDGDGDNTYVIDNTDPTFTNQGYIGTFIVFNPSQTTPSSLAGTDWDPHGGSKGYYLFNSDGSNSGTAQNDDHIFTPQINLTGTNSELKFWARSIEDTYGLERFNIKVSTTDTNIASFTTLSPVTPAPGGAYQEAPTSWTEYTFDLSAYDGQNVYIAFHVVSADAYAFMLDDVSVTTNISLGVQTTVNTADQDTLSNTGTIYATNTSNGDLMVDITNNDNSNYDCVATNVSRAYNAGSPAVQYQSTNPADYVMSKTFDITPTTINVSGNATLKFYFTEAEIAAWEVATGNSRNDLIVIKDNGSPITATTTLGTFVSHTTLEATFNTGIQGTYYFGTINTLSIGENQFEVFNIYPNPTTGNINVVLSSDKDVKIALYDIRGRLVYNELFNNNAGTFNNALNFETVASGIYMLTVESGNKKGTKKLIIH